MKKDPFSCSGGEELSLPHFLLTHGDYIGDGAQDLYLFLGRWLSATIAMGCFVRVREEVRREEEGDGLLQLYVIEFFF